MNDPPQGWIAGTQLDTISLIELSPGRYMTRPRRT
jgi:hypothetical protein